MLDAAGWALRDQLLEIFRAGAGAPLEDESFNRLALEVFNYQFHRNPPYREYCRRQGRTPDDVAQWTEIPAVPTAAFEVVPLVCGDVARAEAVFRTSGTTRGQQRRGEHYVLDLSLYHGSLVAGFAAFVLPDQQELPILSLIPPAAEVPDSSLSHMVSVVMDRLGGSESAYFASVQGGLDAAALEEALLRFQLAGSPVCLLGTSLAFLHWFDRLRQGSLRFRLPPGSRLMDTGGYKGSSRRAEVGELLMEYEEFLGLPGHACVNEYGMTELCSQFYDIGLRERVLGRSGDIATAAEPGLRPKRAPAWVRTRVLDPEHLEPCSAGTPGLLCHLDLANLGSVACVQTEDVGRLRDDGTLELHGRAAGASPRGCSVAMDLLLEAVQDHGH
jgi:hypothetical protein